MAKRTALSLLAAVCVSRTTLAQPPVRVPLGDPAYADLDNIIGSGLVRYVVYGQRPYTRQDVMRMVADANLQVTTHTTSASVKRVLQRLTRRFPSDSTVSPAPPLSMFPVRETSRSATAEVLALGSPPRALFEEPVGDVAADINPLLDNRNGRRYARGANIAFEATDTWQVGNHIGLEFRPRIAAGGAGDGQFAELSLQDLSASISAFNTTLEVGRQPLALGEGMEGGLLMSTGSKSLNMLRLGSDRLWRLPGIFRYAGQLRYNVFIADLGKRQVFPHSKIAVWKVNSRVNPYVELGVGVLVEEGGKGSPTARHFSDRLFDFIPVLLDFTHDDSQYSNKFAGIEMRYRIPLFHAQVYTEHYLDDVNRVFGRALAQDGGHIGGVSIADIGPQGALSAVAEFHHTGLRYYRHRPFTSGIAYNRALLGDQLGPAGDGGYLRLRVDKGGAQRLELNAAVERMGGDIWEAVSGVEPDFYDFHFVIDQSRPAEWHHRVAAQWTMSLRGHQQISVIGGLERLRDAGFIAGERRVRGLANVQYSWLAW